MFYSDHTIDTKIRTKLKCETKLIKNYKNVSHLQGGISWKKKLKL